MAESEEELKDLNESEKAGLKLNVRETKIMACGPITSWQLGRGKVQTVTLFSWVPISLEMVTEL